MVKTVKNLHQSWIADVIETWCTALKYCLIIDIFTERSDLLPYALEWEKACTVDFFPETIGGSVIKYLVHLLN